MITFEQYLEMQWARNVAGWVRDRFRGKPASADPNQPEPGTQPTMTPYGKLTHSSPSYAGDIDYFQGRRGATVGAYGMDMGHEDKNSVHHFDKSSMTPEQKQAFWGMKMKTAQQYVKADIADLVSQYKQSGDPMMSKIASVIAQKAFQYADKMSATYRKGGEAAKGSVNTLTAGGWKNPITAQTLEAYDPQQIAQMFDKMKKDFGRRIAQPEGGKSASQASADKDIMKLYYGIRQQVGKYIFTLKIGGMPQQNGQAGV